MKKKRKIWLVILGIAVVAVAIMMIVNAGKSANKELVIRTHVVNEYTVENTVTATGTIEPVETVEVGTQVSGKVEKIYVDFNDEVKKGQLMAELDKQTLNQSLSRAKASLTSAESQLNYAKLTYERTKQLYESNAATLAAYQEAQNSYTQAQMSKKNAQAAYDQARVDLGYAEIYSPIDGIVLDRAVEVGQTVAASFSTPTLFTLANDLTKMQVEADVDEADIRQVKTGQHVTFTVDAYMNDVFEGTVNQIRMKPTTTSNVVTYKVIIAAPNEENKLYPGMTANVSIVVNEQNGVLVPLEATYFELTPDICKMLKKEGYTLPEIPGMGAPKGTTKGMKPTEKPKENAPDGVSGAPTTSKPATDGKKNIVVMKDKALSLREVKTGLSDGANIVITEGLAEGETVVLSANREKLNTKKAKSLFEGPERRKR